MDAPEQQLYEMELSLIPMGGGNFTVILHDSKYSDNRTGSARLSFAEAFSDPAESQAACFLREFRAGREVKFFSAMEFGKLLLRRLLETPAVADLWNRSNERRSALHMPLRLSVILPRGQASEIADIPLELLADDSGCIFFRHNHSIVRLIQGFELREIPQSDRSKLGMAWANPPVGDPPKPFPRRIFTSEETQVASMGKALGVATLPPCRNATRESLRRYLQTHRPIEIFSLTAHGASGGGLMALRRAGAQPPFFDGVRPDELAVWMREAGVKIVFLWSCWGGRYNPVFGALAEALLDPDKGDAIALVCSHTTLKVSTVEAALRELAHRLEGRELTLERVVGKVRSASNLADVNSWAAPVYYVRHSPAYEPLSRLRQPISAASRNLAFSPLPGRSPHFRGREAEIRQILEELGSFKLITLSGVGGVGKSELALAVAARLVALKGPGGTCWLPLQGGQNVVSLLGQIAAAFGMETCRNLEQLAQKIGETRALLILDHADGLLAGDKINFYLLLETLLRLCPGLSFLVTCRDGLGTIAGQRLWEQVVLSLESAVAREVFIATAGAHLSVAEQTSPELDGLLGMLKGHPLSLVLVAGQVSAGVPLVDLRKRLKFSLSEPTLSLGLTFGAEESPESSSADAGDSGSSNLGISLAFGYAALAERSPLAAEIFDTLVLLPGGMPGSWLAPVFGEASRDAAWSLWRSSLIVIQGVDERLHLPEPFRPFALECFNRRPPADRHARLSRLCHILGRWMDARKGEAVSVREIDNIRELMTYVRLCPPEIWRACQSDLAPALDALRLTLHLLGIGDRQVEEELWVEPAQVAAPVESIWDRLTERVRQDHPRRLSPLFRSNGIRRSETFRSVEDHVGSIGQGATVTDPEEDRARYYLAAGHSLVGAGELGQALGAYEEALVSFSSMGERRGIVETLCSFGNIHLLQEAPEKAEEMYLKALSLCPDPRDPQRADCLLGLADLYTRSDQLARLTKASQQDKSLHEEAIEIYRNLEDMLGQSHALRRLGDFHYRIGAYQQAEISYKEALSVLARIISPVAKADALLALGDLYIRISRPAKAEDCYRAALALSRSFELKLGEANCCHRMGDLYLLTARELQAKAFLEHALELYRTMKSQLGEATVLLSLGDYHFGKGHLDEADDAYSESLLRYRGIGSRLGEANCLKAVGDYYLCLGTYRSARMAKEFYGEALRLQNALKNRLGVADVHIALGDLYARAQKWEPADEAFREALSIYRDDDMRSDEAYVDLQMGNLWLTREHKKAFEFFFAAWDIYSSLGSSFEEAVTNLLLARIAGEAGYPEQSVLLYWKCLEIFVQLQDEDGRRQALKELAEVLAALNEPASSRAATAVSRWAAMDGTEDLSELQAAVLRQRKNLSARGKDPYSSLADHA